MTSKREDREALITEAAEAILEAMGGIVPDELESMHADAAKAALAVFEQAHTPTGDERESGRLAIEGVLKACMLTFATSYEDAAGMAIDAVFDALRRPVQGEPSEVQTEAHRKLLDRANEALKMPRGRLETTKKLAGLALPLTVALGLHVRAAVTEQGENR